MLKTASYYNPEFVSERISVIIPAYNYGEYLPLTIDSVLTQHLADLEIIVVDDGSIDDTQLVLKPYRDRIKYIYQRNRGLSAARNTGIRHSTGEFIQFLDADDMLGPGSIQAQKQFLRNHPDVSIAVSRNRLFSTTDSNGLPRFNGEWHLFEDSLVVHLCHLNIAPPHAFFSRRQAIVETGEFDLSLKACEDWDYWLRAATRGIAFAYNPEGVVYYRRHADSMSAKAGRQLYFDSILHERLSDLFDRFPEFPAGKRLEALLAFCAGAVYTAGKLKTYHPDLVDQIMSSALQRTVEAREIAVRYPREWNSLIKLNYTRSISRLMYPFFHRSRIASEIRQNLDRILAAVKAPQRKFHLMGNLMFTAISDPSVCAVQKKILRGLLGRIIKNRLLKYLDRWQVYKPKKCLLTGKHFG